MKYLVLAIIILNTKFLAYSQDENIIYKMIIDEYSLKYRQPNIKNSSTTLIILKTPQHMREFDLNDFSRYKEKYKKLDEKTFLDFLEKNQKGMQLEKYMFSGNDIIIVDQEQCKSRKELLTIYPNWNGSILEFSNIGLNEEKNQAFVYYGFDSGPGVGGGIYIIFEKRNGKWKSKVVIPAWAA